MAKKRRKRMTMKENERKKNWQRRFYILLTVNIVVLFFLAIYIYSPIPEEEIKRSSERYKEEQSSEFIVRTTKQNVNNLVNAYLDKLLAGTKHQYSINLDEDVQLFGELPIFSSTVPLLIHLEPIVQEN